MTREDLQKVIPEITEENLNKIMKLHGDATNKLKGENERLTGELQTAKTTIDTYEKKIKEFEAEDVDGMKQKIKNLETDIQKRKDEEAEAERINNLSERFKGAFGGKEWINDFTRDGIKAKFIDAVSDKSNAGKSDSDIFNALVQDEKGNYIDGLFKSEGPQIDIPGINNNSGMGDMATADLRAAMGLPAEKK